VSILPGGGEIMTFDIAPTPSGGVVLEGGSEIEAFFWKLTGDGLVDRHFGKGGFLELRKARKKPGYHEELFVAPQFAVLPSGKLLLAATGYPNRGPSSGFRAVAVRLHPDGRVDRSYGEDGWASVGRGAGGTFAEGLALLPGGVLAIAVTFENRPSSEKREFGAIAFGPDGRLERRFGNQGRCHAPLPGEQEALGVVPLGRRAAVVGSGEGDQWLLNCRIK
jgi:hypothetical protein